MYGKINQLFPIGLSIYSDTSENSDESSHEDLETALYVSSLATQCNRWG